MFIRLAILVALSFGPALFAGCLKIQKEAPEKHQFVLDVTRPAGGPAGNPNGVLQVNEFQIPDTFQGRGFRYRMQGSRLESDFYNEFFSPPAQMITDEVRQWFDRSGLFKVVITDSGLVEPSHFLGGTVEEISGDYGSNPLKAVLELEFVLTKQVRGRDNIVFAHRYREEQPIESKSPENLVQAWNQSLLKTLQALESDLRSQVFGKQ